MQHTAQYQADWLREKINHAKRLDILQRRVDPLEEELDTLYDMIDANIKDTPTWRDCVVEPILRDIRETYGVKVLADWNSRQIPAMVVAPSTDERGPVSFIVSFRSTDTTTGDFTVTVTGYSATHGKVEEIIQSGDMLTTEYIIKQIDKVRDQL